SREARAGVPRRSHEGRRRVCRRSVAYPCMCGRGGIRFDRRRVSIAPSHTDVAAERRLARAGGRAASFAIAARAPLSIGGVRPEHLSANAGAFSSARLSAACRARRAEMVHPGRLIQPDQERTIPRIPATNPPPGDVMGDMSRYIDRAMNSKFITRKIANETIIVPLTAEVADLDAVYTLNEVGSF